MSNLTEPLAVFDRRKNKQVATIYPVESKSANIVEFLAGSLSGETTVSLNDEELDSAIRESTEASILEKHQRFLQQCKDDESK